MLSIMKINIAARISDSMLMDAEMIFLKKVRGIKGIRPELCPAIRDFHSAGSLICNPTNLSFLNKFSFEVRHYKSNDGKEILSPGVIGDPKSERFYARVDTGLSFIDIPCPVMAIKNHHLTNPLNNIEIPPVIYPQNYTGPILIAISSDFALEVPKHTPLLHIIPLYPTKVSITISSSVIVHENFEGLLYQNYLRDTDLLNITTSDKLVIHNKGSN
jgi:hypothetical protein